MRPQNRYRSNQSSMVCSRCTSVLSVNNSRMTSRCTSQMSLHHMPSMHRKASNVSTAKHDVDSPILCKICLVDCPMKDTYRLHQCRCVFCKDVSFQQIPCLRNARACNKKLCNCGSCRIIIFCLPVHGPILELWNYGRSLRNQLSRPSLWERVDISVSRNRSFGWQRIDG